MFGRSFVKPMAVLFFPIAPLCGFDAPRQTDDSSPAVTVYVSFQEEYSANVFEAIKAEIEAIMTPIGLRFEWRSLDSAQNDVAYEVVVVTFKGKCTAGSFSAPCPSPNKLGWTHVSGGEVLPFIVVDCSHIRELISSQLPGGDCIRGERLFGRAIARVLAHEFYHTFANNTRHSAAGLAKASFTPAELISPELRFQPREADDLRSGVLNRLLRSYSASKAELAGRALSR